MTDLFSTENQSPDTSSTEVDVEAVKQKFGNDIGAIAKSKAEADRHIKNLEAEQAELRSELKTRLTLEQFMDEIKSSKTSSNTQENLPVENEDTKEYVSREEALRIAREAYKQEQNLSSEDANRKIVSDALRKNWGSSYLDKLVSKATEIGLSKEQVNSMAATSPQALLKLVDANVTTNVSSFAPPSNQVRSDQRGSSDRDYSHYKKLRKENPNLYWAPRTQRQMHADKARLGDEFGND